jgi:hypothetical protein
MLLEFMADHRNSIVKTIIYSHDYMNMVQTITKDARDPKIYDFLFTYLFALLEVPAWGVGADRIVALVREKCQADPEFASFVLSKSDRIIPFLLKNTLQTSRDYLVTIVNTSLKSSSSPHFITGILHAEKVFDFWTNFDQIFQPVYFYVSQIDDTREDILTCFAALLDETIIAHFGDRRADFDACIKAVNLSHVFKTILRLLTSLGKSAEFEGRIIQPAFMDRWFSSGCHSFDFALLISFFLRDNKEHTDRYLEYVSKTNSVNSTAAHFASVCSLNDSLSSVRIQWFFDFIQQKKWEIWDVANFVRDTAAKLTGNETCAALLPFSDHWLKKWLLNNDSSVRRSLCAFVYGMFPSFPAFKLPQGGGYALPPTGQPVEAGEPEATQMDVLFEKLLALNKDIAAQCKSCSTISLQNGMYIQPVMSSTQYFELLAWCVHHRKMRAKVLAAKAIFLDLLSVFAGFKSDCKMALMDLLHFFSSFSLGTAFWDSKTLSALLSAVSKMPKGKELLQSGFVDAVAADLFPLLLPIAPSHRFLIANSKIFREMLQFCLAPGALQSENCRALVLELAEDSRALETISSRLLEQNTFRARYTTGNSAYLGVVAVILERGQVALEQFQSNKCHRTVADNILKLLKTELTQDVSDQLISSFGFLMKFWEYFRRAYQKGDWVSSKPAKIYTEFWKSRLDIINGIRQLLQQPNVTIQLASAAHFFIFAVFANQPQLNSIALDFLENEPEDFYSRIHRDLRKRFAEFSISVLNGNFQPKTVIKLALRDLSRLVQFEVFDYELYLLYGDLLQKFSKEVDAAQVSEIFDRLIVSTDDLMAFTTWRIPIVASSIGKVPEKKSRWIDKCGSLTMAALSAVTAAITDRHASWLMERLQAAKYFVESVKEPLRVQLAPPTRALLADLAESPLLAVKSLGEVVTSLFPVGQ